MGDNQDADRIVVQLFGTFSARRGDQPLPNLRRREGERLLAYLLLHANVPLASKDLAQRFWPFEAQNNPGEHGDYPNLRQALRSLRQALGSEAERLTRPHRTTVQMDVSGLDVDVFTFDRLAHVTEEAEWPTAYAEAVALYRGPLLSAWNEPWLAAPRKRRQRDYEMMLRRLIQRAQQHEQNEDVLRWTHLLVEACPDDETVRRDLLLLSKTGTYAAAASQTEVENDSVCIAAHPAVIETVREAAKEAETLTLDAVGGAVPLQSPFYITRDADTEFDAALARRDAIVLLKGSRQVGKTSLLGRGLVAARQTQARVVVTDCQKINESALSNLDALYRNLALSLIQQLGVSVSFRDVWDEDFGPNMNFERFLCLHVLPPL